MQIVIQHHINIEEWEKQNWNIDDNALNSKVMAIKNRISVDIFNRLEYCVSVKGSTKDIKAKKLFNNTNICTTKFLICNLLSTLTIYILKATNI